MKSTGEVLGIDKSFEAALMKGLLAAGFSFTNKKKGGVLFTLKDADKYEFLSAAEKFKELGFTIYATAGTYKVLSEHEIDAVAVNRSYEPEPNIMTVLESGEIDYVVSTSAHGKDPKKEGVKIRRKSVERSIICLTSADTVAALLKCLKSGIHEETLVPVDINTL